MRRHIFTLALALGLLVGSAACSSGDDEQGGAASTTATSTMAEGETTVITTGTTQTTAATDGTESTMPDPGEPIPTVTPPADQPEACTLLLAAVGADAAAVVVQDDPAGSPAPSTGCRTTTDDAVSLALFYGQDPLEILAGVRALRPGGTDVTGVGQDAYQLDGTLFVDNGSRAFAVSGSGQDLVAIAQNVIGNL